MKKITTFFLLVAVLLGSGANAQQGVKGDAFYAKFDQNAQAVIKANGAENVITSYLDGDANHYFRISRDTLAYYVYQIALLADEQGYPSLVTGPDNASDLFRSSNYGTETVAALKASGITNVKMGRMLYGKVDFYNQPLSGLDNAIEFGVLYDANNVPFPVIKKGINSVTQCCLNLCYAVVSDGYSGGDGGGEQYSGQKVQRSSNGDVYVYNYNTITGSGNANQSQDQTQTGSAPAPEQQGSTLVPAEISYREVPMQAPVNYGTNYNAGYSAPPKNYDNSGMVMYNNKPNAVEVIDLFVDIANLGVGIYGANQAWQANNKPAPIVNVTGGNTTYDNSTYNTGNYGNGLLNPFGTTVGTGTGTGPVGPGNGGLGNDQ